MVDNHLFLCSLNSPGGRSSVQRLITDTERYRFRESADSNCYLMVSPAYGLHLSTRTKNIDPNKKNRIAINDNN